MSADHVGENAADVPCVCDRNDSLQRTVLAFASALADTPADAPSNLSGRPRPRRAPTRTKREVLIDGMTAAADLIDTGGLRCHDCGLLYSSEGWCDVVLTDEDWLTIAPHLDRPHGGVLCFNCIACRLTKAGRMNVPMMVTSGPFLVRTEREGLRLEGARSGRHNANGAGG